MRRACCWGGAEGDGSAFRGGLDALATLHLGSDRSLPHPPTPHHTTRTTTNNNQTNKTNAKNEPIKTPTNSLEAAVLDVYTAGDTKTLTPDVGGSGSTQSMTAAIVGRLG